MRDELVILWRAVGGTRCVLLRDEGQWEVRIITADVIERTQLFASAERAHEAALQWRDDVAARHSRLTAHPTFW